MHRTGKRSCRSLCSQIVLCAAPSVLLLLSACSASSDADPFPSLGDVGGGPGLGPDAAPDARARADGSSNSSSGGGGGGGISDDGGLPESAGDDSGSAPDGATGTANEGGDGTPTAFVHPGALVNGAQLDFLKTKVAAGTEPWASALSAAKSDDHASLSYSPHPPTDTNGDVGCGPVSMPDIHCSDEKSDASAAYADAVIWAITGDTQYAAKAITILDAWSAVMKSHSLDNAPLQSGWTGTLFARAAEIVRYTPAGWPAAKVDQFAAMIKTAYVPYLVKGTPGGNGNWELSQADALMQIAVFLDDRASFDTAVALWKRRVPGYIYMSTDGANPVDVGSTWNGATQYFDGLCQETCRDLSHVQYGFAGMINAAETARIQGVDLYSLEAKRIVAGLELHAGYINTNTGKISACSLQSVSAGPMWEIAYNEYANRLSMSLPNVKTLIGQIRPTWIDHHMDFESLTHAEVGSVGLH
jgi:hypothetical protein